MMNVPPLILALVVILYIISRKSSIKEKFLPLYGYLVGANDRLYNLLNIMHSVFTKNDIPYAITGDVLLSTVELEKLSRGQTQASVLIPQEYVDVFLQSSDEFLALGLGISDLRDGGYRLSSSISLPVVTDTAIMIFPVTNTGDKWITTSRYLGYNEWYNANELFPAKSYKLGNLDIMGPLDPIGYLQRNFWELGIHAKSINKRWYQVPPTFYGTNKVPVLPVISPVDYRNGIRIDPRPIPRDKTTVILGNGRTAVIPNVGTTRIFPRQGRWRRFLWT